MNNTPINDGGEASAVMTLRDWFAGQALSGMLAGGLADIIPLDSASCNASYFAYLLADKMLAERGKP
jgi:hypothetical protein